MIRTILSLILLLATFSNVFGNEIEDAYENEKYQLAFDLAKKELSVKESAIAKRIIGLTYWDNIVEVRNVPEAIKWLRQAAQLSDAKASYWLGYIYELTTNVPDKDKLAFEFYSNALNAGNKDAYYRLGLKYLTGEYVQKDVRKARELFVLVPLESSDWVNAQISLAQMELNGLGMEKNIGNAIHKLEKIALTNREGSWRAMRKLSLIFSDNTYKIRNLKASKEWLAKAKIAERDFANKYLNKDYGLKAVETANIFAQQGNELAQVAIYAYYLAMGKPNWLKKNAIQMLNSAVENGEYNATLLAAWAYFKGTELDKDLEKANVLAKTIMPVLMQKANEGDRESQENLAILYFYGLGVEKDYTLARKWNKISKTNGSTARADYLKKMLDEVESN